MVFNLQSIVTLEEKRRELFGCDLSSWVIIFPPRKTLVLDVYLPIGMEMNPFPFLTGYSRAIRVCCTRVQHRLLAGGNNGMITGIMMRKKLPLTLIDDDYHSTN